MEQIPWSWPPLSNSIVISNYTEMDLLINKNKCVVLSLGFLKSRFQNVCHGIRASFVWAWKNNLPLYIRHLEDFGNHCDLSHLQQLLICIKFAKDNDIPILAFTSDISLVYKIVVKEFVAEMMLSKPHDSFSNVSIQYASFADVTGRNTIKSQLLSLYQSTKNVEGLIFYGTPGKGKTLMARAVFGELSKSKIDRPYFLNIAIHDILKTHVGESESAIKSIFQHKSDYMIIFMDELDVLFSDLRESYTQKILWQIHAEIDKLVDNPNKKTLIIGATNYIDCIPNSLKRRLPHHILFD